MSHSYNKSDGVFPHKKDGGVLGHPSKGAKSKALAKAKDEKKIQHFKDIKEHVSGGKKSGGFNDPFWYKKK